MNSFESTLIIGIFVFLVVLLVVRIVKAKNLGPSSMSGNLSDGSEFSETAVDFEKDFFLRAKGGENAVEFLKIADMQDCFVIQSMLLSAGIPSHTENEHVSGIFGNNAGIMNSIFAVRLNILKDDYNEALSIVKDFLEQKVKALADEGNAPKTAENAGEKLLSLEQSLKEQGQAQVLGITVLA